MAGIPRGAVTPAASSRQLFWVVEFKTPQVQVGCTWGEDCWAAVKDVSNDRRPSPLSSNSMVYSSRKCAVPMATPW
jgi:hypothetical protein